MTHVLLIPEELRFVHKRALFIAWLQSLPLLYHDRLHVYFSWIDALDTSYTDDDIIQLKEQPYEPPL